MESIGDALTRKLDNVINNDNDVDKYNYDNNVNENVTDSNSNSSKKGKYALNRNKFTPNTEETQLAEKVATFFDDLSNYAFYLHVVNRLGVNKAYMFFRSVQEEIEKKGGTRYEIRNPKRYFAWKFKKGIYD